MSWKLLGKDYLIKNRWIKVRKDHVLQPSGVEIDDFYVIERPNLVHVIAITSDNQFILERQFRDAINKDCYEICAGIIEPDEKPIEAAKRELLEETGYSGGEWMPFGEYAIDPSNMTDISYAFVAKGVVKVKEQTLEPTESLIVELVNKDKLVKLMQSDKIVSGLMLAPLLRYISVSNVD